MPVPIWFNPPNPLIIPAALCVTVPAEFNLKKAPDAPMVIGALIVISLAAVKVRLLPVDQLIGLETVMVPALLPAVVVFVVVIITLLAPRALTSTAVSTIEVFAPAVGEQVPAVQVSLVFEPPLFIIVTFAGSKSHVPVAPCGAEVSTLIPFTANLLCPEVSINPPLPLKAPPLALKLPETLVKLSDQIIILPPLPLVKASAEICVFLSTDVFNALGCGPEPWKLPPIKIWPPPDWPSA